MATPKGDDDPFVDGPPSPLSQLPTTLSSDMAMDPDDVRSQIMLEVDEDAESFTDIDSALGDIWDTSSASLQSSIMRSREENGREYHGYKEGRYVLPTDEPELIRQGMVALKEFQYELCLRTFSNRLHLAPIIRPGRVLDAGCGTGRWAVDFAEEHPESQVLGVDLAPVQPGFTPGNCQFEIDDLEEDWNYTYKFDYIHVMMMTGAFRDWPRFIQQSFDNLQPGCWFELQDIDFPLRCDDTSIVPGSPLMKWNDLMMQAAETSGFLLNTCGRAADMMADVGFVEIVRVPFKWPINRWPADARHKNIGMWTEQNFVSGLEGMCLAYFTRFLGWSREQVLDFVATIIPEWRNMRRHGYFDLYITYGRKPMT